MFSWCITALSSSAALPCVGEEGMVDMMVAWVLAMIQLSENEMDDWLRGGARNQGMRADVEKHVRALVECTWVEGEAAGWLTAIRRARDRPRGRYRPFDPRRGGGVRFACK